MLIDGARQGWEKVRHRRTLVVVCGLVLVVVTGFVMGSLIGTGTLRVVDPELVTYPYLAVFLLVTLDAVVPIFPGETTLNAASTAAANGDLELLPVMVTGALGAIVGDSILFWTARRAAPRVEARLERARAHEQLGPALALLDSSAPLMIVAGRYVVGMRFVVNATMGLSTMPYRRFLPWSALGGALWSLYTCTLAYLIGTALVGYPMASIVISSLVTTISVSLLARTWRRRRRSAMSVAPQ